MELDFLSPVLLAALQAEAPHPRRLLRPRSTLGRGVEFSRFLALARGEGGDPAVAGEPGEGVMACRSEASLAR